VVKGVEFVNLRDAGDPVELAVRYQEEGADEIVFLDITASHEQRETVAELARRCADDLFIPFTIGGGVRSAADAQGVLDAGAEKVSVNSAAVARPELLSELAEVFGAQCVVLAIDARREDVGRYGVYVQGGRAPVGRLEHLVDAVNLGGADAVLCASIFHYGTHTVREAKETMREAGIPVRL
jgi:cyclase